MRKLLLLSLVLVAAAAIIRWPRVQPLSMPPSPAASERCPFIDFIADDPGLIYRYRYTLDQNCVPVPDWTEGGAMGLSTWYSVAYNDMQPKGVHDFRKRLKAMEGRP
jgi:hypothetical protein